MDDKYILISPHFIKNRKHVALISKHTSMIDAMRSFIDQINQHLFKKHESNISFVLFDINNIHARKFIINQTNKNDTLVVSYNEVQYSKTTDKLIFDDYIYSLNKEFTAVLEYMPNMKLPALRNSIEFRN